MKHVGIFFGDTAQSKRSQVLELLDLLIWGLFIVVLIGVVLASQQWWNEGRGQVKTCVKIPSVGWKTTNTRSARAHLGYLTYQSSDGGVVQTTKSLLFVPSSDDYRASAAAAMTNATCVDLWIRPGSEVSPSLEQIKVPLTRSGSAGQWLLGLLLLLLCCRSLVSKDTRNARR